MTPYPGTVRSLGHGDLSLPIRPELHDARRPPGITGWRRVRAAGVDLFLGPLVLLALGFSGAWIGNLSVLEPYRPWFIGAALIALGLAWRRILRPAGSCAPGAACALPRVGRGYCWMFAIVVMLVLVALAFPIVAPLFY